MRFCSVWSLSERSGGGDASCGAASWACARRLSVETGLATSIPLRLRSRRSGACAGSRNEKPRPDWHPRRGVAVRYNRVQRDRTLVARCPGINRGRCVRFATSLPNGSGAVEKTSVVSDFDRLCDAVDRASQGQLDDIVQLACRSWAASRLGDADLEELYRRVDLRRRAPSSVELAKQADTLVRRLGARPRRPEHVGRRRSWVASGLLPPALASRFTVGQAAVLSVIASVILEAGACLLCNQALADRAGVCVSTVKTAKRFAAACGLLIAKERRVSAQRNDTSVVRIVSPEWLSWLRFRRARGGVKKVTPFPYALNKEANGGSQVASVEPVRKPSGPPDGVDHWRTGRRTIVQR